MYREFAVEYDFSIHFIPFHFIKHSEWRWMIHFIPFHFIKHSFRRFISLLFTSVRVLGYQMRYFEIKGIELFYGTRLLDTFYSVPFHKTLALRMRYFFSFFTCKTLYVSAFFFTARDGAKVQFSVFIKNSNSIYKNVWIILYWVQPPYIFSRFAS
jgi:hypothetical protein